MEKSDLVFCAIDLKSFYISKFIQCDKKCNFLVNDSINSRSSIGLGFFNPTLQIRQANTIGLKIIKKVFSIYPPSPLYQGNTLSLANAIISLVDFLTAPKMMACLSVLACLLD